MLTQDRLKEFLSYDPETGIFKRIIPSGGVLSGAVLGSDNGKGYLCIWVDNKKYKSHRLAFLYMEGYLPEHQVDHINGIRGDIRWCNLRHVSQMCNSQNQKLRITNTSGYNGVVLNKVTKKWMARITINHKQIYLGIHCSALEAALHRITAEDWCPDWHCDERCENRNKVFSDLRELAARVEGGPAE